MMFVDRIDGVDAKEVKRVFKELITAYMNPAYGSMSKRDFDILLFMKLQDLKIIEKDPDLYDIVSNLKVTRAKARNLLYEAKMRNSSEEMLDKELKELLSTPIFFKENDKIAIEISNPLLSDHLRWKLKRLGYITDGSFSAELIKLSEEAYITIFEDMIPNESRKKITKALVKCGAREELGFKGILSSILKKLSGRIVGRAGDELVDGIFKYLDPLISEKLKEISSVYKNFFVEPQE